MRVWRETLKSVEDARCGTGTSGETCRCRADPAGMSRCEENDMAALEFIENETGPQPGAKSSYGKAGGGQTTTASHRQSSQTCRGPVRFVVRMRRSSGHHNNGVRMGRGTTSSGDLGSDSEAGLRKSRPDRRMRARAKEARIRPSHRYGRVLAGCAVALMNGVRPKESSPDCRCGFIALAHTPTRTQRANALTTSSGS